ncbi:MAG: peptide chain release factor N(5)-glutamine methyltransferase [Micrococcales bacterium]|nr:peptide chain release factor N(5)-glutamine methyltransferase [Actinomycetota bacterium]NCA08185.1 peptide chain release factor N(5)-glutamine methyltransferase [Micrococcales bacterium]
MKLSVALESATKRFENAGIESAQADAEILASFVLGINRGELLSKTISEDSFAAEEKFQFEELVIKRAERFPLQHLTGFAYFRQLELKVGPGVFVPRFETEGVTQLAVDALKAVPKDAPIAVDLATGSGAIALCLATEVPNSKVFAVELSNEALVYTRENFARYAPSADLRQGDLADAFAELDGQVDVLISNPPYIPDQMIPIYPEVHLHDPTLALYGGIDGLDLIRKVDASAKRLLRPGGTLVIEHADMQGKAVQELLLASGWRSVATHKDLAGRDRATTGIR